MCEPWSRVRKNAPHKATAVRSVSFGVGLFRVAAPRAAACAGDVGAADVHARAAKADPSDGLEIGFVDGPRLFVMTNNRHPGRGLGPSPLAPQ